MSVNSEIERLQNAKSALKTAIEGKGVSVPASTKLDGYPALVDSIEQGGGGGSVPYIVNPLNGTTFGSSDHGGGIYTHQYQVSSGNIVDAFFVDSSCGSGVGVYNNDKSIHMQELQFCERYYNVRYGSVLEVTSSGLLTLTLPDVGYSWLLDNAYWMVILVLDSGYNLYDYFDLYNAWTCFIKDTNIMLANKTNKKIQDITYDNELLVWNFDEGKYDSAKPLWIKKTETTTWYYKLKFSNGLELNVTGAYPEAHSLFSVEDGRFIHANKLVGKKVYTLDGIATLESCEEVHENVEFYNIITNYHMNLFANNVLTSTSLNNLYPIKDMKFVKEDREPVFDYTQFSDDWIVGARLKEQPTDVTKYCLNCIKLTK